MVFTRFLKSVFLRNHYSLQKQLFYSFGTVGVLTIGAVVIVAVTCTFAAQHVVETAAEALLEQQILDRLMKNTVFISDTLGAHMEGIEGSVQLSTEFVRDRIVGYPAAGWEEDIYVPFLDMDTNSYKYPLKAQPLSLDWNFTQTFGAEDMAEHVQERVSRYQTQVSTLGTYFQQGACDPDETDPMAGSYYANCSDANNNITTGGVVFSTDTARGLYAKSAELAVLFKPIYEATPDAIHVAMSFVNSGAGAQITYPGYTRSPSMRGVSEGCDWMRETNPYTGRPFATEEEISKCKPVGAAVPHREYNGMERGWCGEFARNPTQVKWYDPSFTQGGVNHVSVGKAVFDRRTGELIGCVGIDVSLSQMLDVLRKSQLHDRTEISLVRYETGEVLVDTLGMGTESGNIADTNFPISRQDFKEIRSLARSTGTAQAVISNEKGYLTAHPIIHHHGLKEPDYLVLQHTAFSVIQDVLESGADFDDEVMTITRTTVIVGVVGMLLVLLIVYLVSRAITKPLLWIERVSSDIVKHKDEAADVNLARDQAAGPQNRAWCARSTEVAQLTLQFQFMIGNYSGNRASSVALADINEIPNGLLSRRSDYHQLCTQDHFPSNIRLKDHHFSVESTAATETSAEFSFLGEEGPVMRSQEVAGEPSVDCVDSIAPKKKNLGRNVRRPPMSNSLHDVVPRKSSFRSPLFWWILIAIGAPLVLICGGICAYVSQRIVFSFPNWLGFVEAGSLQLEIDALEAKTELKSLEAEVAMNEIAQDIYVMTRVAQWLFFGAVGRTDSFTKIETGAEECKTYPRDKSCPFFDDPARAVCDCEWQDLRIGSNYTSKGLTGECRFYNETDSRYLQHRFWTGTTRDRDPDTGSRTYARAFLEEGLDSSAATTSWFVDANATSGSEKGASAAGYATTYDRLRVASALAVVEIPVYNYATAIGLEKHALGSRIGFQADGMTTGYNGCQYGYTGPAHFRASEKNGAPQLAPDLCPEGKFGYDARCRDWYTSGYETAQEGGSIHITPPYAFANAEAGSFAATATSPIINPRTGEYVGQTSFDFVPNGLNNVFDDDSDDLSFVITAADDNLGGDTVIAPGKKGVLISSKITDLLFANDDDGSVNRQRFESGVLKEMKGGQRGKAEIRRFTADGSIETLRIAYRPVNVRALLPTSPDNFSSGANVSKQLVYSIGVAYSEELAHQPWAAIEETVTHDLSRIRNICISLCAAVLTLFIAFAVVVALTVSRPIATLLLVVKNINDGSIDKEDIPPLVGGSREVSRVYNSFAKLYKILYVSNQAFFAGNHRWAYGLISDALALFRKTADTKAIGVACNNLANTLHAIYCDKQEEGECCRVFEGICCVKEAIGLYNEAIALAERDLEDPTDGLEWIEFAQTLADRVYNRGLFYLIASGECAPADHFDLGLQDIQRVRDLDASIRDALVCNNVLHEMSEVYYLRLIRRMTGLVDFCADQGLCDVWNIRDLIVEADQFLFSQWNHPKSKLFEAMTRIGRLQQLESVAIRVDVAQGRVPHGLALAMRIFSEDEYIAEQAFVSAASCLLTAMGDEKLSNAFSASTKITTRSDLVKMLKMCRRADLDLGKCLVFAIQIHAKWEGSTLLDKVNENCLRFYDECCRGDDYVAVVASTTKQGEFGVGLGAKQDDGGRQRSTLDVVTSTTSTHAFQSLSFATQMVMDSVFTLEHETFLVWIVDDISWDEEAVHEAKQTLEHLNQGKHSNIHVIVLGFNIENTDSVEQGSSLSEVSALSTYVAVDESNVEMVFSTLITTFRGYQTGVVNAGLSMEKF